MELISPKLSTNTVLEILILAFLLVNIIAYLAPGMMKNQVNQVFETRNERAFVPVQSKHYVLRTLLIVQFFLFYALHFFLLLSDDPAARLQHPSEEDWHLLVKCIVSPVAWVCAQMILFNWWGSLISSGSGRLLVMNRVYQSIHILVSPAVMVAFMLELVDIIDVETATFLLSLIFIIIQIMFIFSGIKIFWGGWSTLCFLFLYLCALEIAPLAMIYQLLTR